MSIQIRPYQESYRGDMIGLWERSVRATHHFLEPGDIDFFKKLVSGIDFTTFEVYCAFDNDTMVGILGVADRKLEMLFLSPDQIGKGIGRRLMEFALDELHVNAVDVNEDNSNAVEFYKRFHFRIFDRTQLDDHGKPYPILKMKL